MLSKGDRPNLFNLFGKVTGSRKRLATPLSSTDSEVSFLTPVLAPAVDAALVALGRTEDIQFSPDNSRLAICGFYENRILVLDVERHDTNGRLRLSCSRYVELVTDVFEKPHGLVWLDGETLAVASREANVIVFKVPPAAPDATRVTVEPLATIHANSLKGLEVPGSLASIDLGDGRHELLVCNNIGNTVTSHLLNTRQHFALESNVVMLEEGFLTPDGLAISPQARWIAVSNHFDHSVYLFRNEPDLNRKSKPVGQLRGVHYAHGICFSNDNRHMFVADAGAPFLHVYRSENGDWSGIRYPVTRLRVLDEDQYERGRDNPQEGGAKGVDLTADGSILVTTCEEARLVCLDVRDITTGKRQACDATPIKPSRRKALAKTAAERHRRILLMAADEKENETEIAS